MEIGKTVISDVISEEKESHMVQLGSQKKGAEKEKKEQIKNNYAGSHTHR